MEKYANIEGRTFSNDKGKVLENEILAIKCGPNENQKYYKSLLKEYQGLNKIQSPISKKVKFNGKPKSIIMSNSSNLGLLEQMASSTINQVLRKSNQSGSGRKLNEKLVSDGAVNFDRKHIRSVSVPLFPGEGEEPNSVSLPKPKSKNDNAIPQSYCYKQNAGQDSQKSNFTKSIQINKRTYATETLKDQTANINETEAKPPPLSNKSQRKNDKISIQEIFQPQSLESPSIAKVEMNSLKPKAKQKEFHCCLIY